MFVDMRASRILGTPTRAAWMRAKAETMSGAGVTDAGNESNDRVEPETEFSSGDAHEVVHDQGEPFEKRLETLTLPLFFRRQDFPIDFLERRLHWRRGEVLRARWLT